MVGMTLSIGVSRLDYVGGQDHGRQNSLESGELISGKYKIRNSIYS